MAMLNLIQSRRSIRAYKGDPVPEEELNYILEAARWAPSSANSQPWDIVVVRNPQTKGRIQDSIKRCVARIKELRDFPFLRTFSGSYMLEAPVQLVVCADPRFKYVSMMHNVHFEVEEFAMWGSISMAIQNMLLAAHSRGLGSVVFTNFFPEDLKQLLNIPDPLKVLCILPIGYPNQQKEPPTRRSLDDFVHWECFDKSKMRSNELIEEAHKDPYGVQVKNY